MNFFNPSLKYGISETPILKKVKEEKVGEETEQTDKTENIPEIDTKETKFVDASALDVVARMNLGTVEGLIAKKSHATDAAIGPHGEYPAISELEALINQWYAENENLSYDEKINLLTRIIDLLDENSETFEADNRNWRTIRHTVYAQHRYEYFQGILDDPDFNPETFDWDTVVWDGGSNFPDETTAFGLYENGEQYGLPGCIVSAVGDNLVYNYHEQKTFHEYNVNSIRYSIAFYELFIQRPDLTDEQRASIQQTIAQMTAALENNLWHLQDVTIGCEYEDKAAEWEANSQNMTKAEKIVLINEMLGLLGQMIQAQPVTAAIANWTEIKDSLINSPEQQYEALK